VFGTWHSVKLVKGTTACGDRRNNITFITKRGNFFWYRAIENSLNEAFNIANWQLTNQLVFSQNQQLAGLLKDIQHRLIFQDRTLWIVWFSRHDIMTDLMHPFVTYWVQSLNNLAWLRKLSKAYILLTRSSETCDLWQKICIEGAAKSWR